MRMYTGELHGVRAQGRGAAPGERPSLPVGGQPRAHRLPGAPRHLRVESGPLFLDALEALRPLHTRALPEPAHPSEAARAALIIYDCEMCVWMREEDANWFVMLVGNKEVWENVWYKEVTGFSVFQERNFFTVATGGGEYIFIGTEVGVCWIFLRRTR